MCALALHNIPEGDEWLYEVKFDGYVFRGKNMVGDPLSKRRIVLDDLFNDLRKIAGPIGLPETIDATPAELVPRLRRDVAKHFKGLEIDSCPFVNLPEKKRTTYSLTREEMKPCV